LSFPFSRLDRLKKKKMMMQHCDSLYYIYYFFGEVFFDFMFFIVLKKKFGRKKKTRQCQSIYERKEKLNSNFPCLFFTIFVETSSKEL